MTDQPQMRLKPPDHSFDDLAARLVSRGFSPHTKPAPSELVPDGVEMWWDKGAVSQFNWPTAATLVGLMFFFLVMLKGWPWG